MDLVEIRINKIARLKILEKVRRRKTRIFVVPRPVASGKNCQK
jgi:hypothetical protein